MADAITFNTSGVKTPELQRLYDAHDVTTPEELADLAEAWLLGEAEEKELYKEKQKDKDEQKKIKLK